MDNTNTQTNDPLLTAYVTSLEASLKGVDPREKAETLAGINEYITESLQAGKDAQIIIAELGPVEAIAAAATQVPEGTEQNSGTDVALLVVSLMGLLLVIPFPPLALLIEAIVLVVTIVRLRAKTGNRTLLRATCIISSIALVIAIVLLSIIIAGALFWSTSGSSTSAIFVPVP